MERIHFFLLPIFGGLMKNEPCQAVFSANMRRSLEIASWKQTQRNATNTGEHVMQYRYASRFQIS
jgi:hypothetical protein